MALSAAVTPAASFWVGADLVGGVVIETVILRRTLGRTGRSCAPAEGTVALVPAGRSATLKPNCPRGS